MTSVPIALSLFLVAVVLVAIAAPCGAIRLVAHYRRARLLSRRRIRIAWLTVGLGLIGLGCVLFGALVEVNRLSITMIEVRTPRLPAGTRVRIVQISDTHVDGPTRVLSALPEVVNSLDADVLVFSGDALNATAGLPVFEETLSRVRTRFGRFAVQGNFDDGSELAGGRAAKELAGIPVQIAGGLVTLCGAPFDIGNSPRRQIASCLASSQEGARVIVYHTPDLVEELSPLGADLYLAGHTHGGQVRLPWYGALITMSEYGKKYEMGRYLVGVTTLFVSRGIGAEKPRVRFLCPPEVAVIDLVGEDSPR
ncbi:MAG: metallophosphoesterase [Pseudomonadota bacterium]